ASQFHCSSRLRAGADQDIQIFLAKRPAFVRRVKLNDAKAVARLAQQRHAHDGANLVQSHALAEIEALIGAGVNPQDRFAGFDGVANNRLTDRQGVPPRILAEARGLRRELPGRGVLQQYETAIRLRKDHEQALENLRQDILQLEDVAEIAGNLQNG